MHNFFFHNVSTYNKGLWILALAYRQNMWEECFLDSAKKNLFFCGRGHTNQHRISMILAHFHSRLTKWTSFDESLPQLTRPFTKCVLILLKEQKFVRKFSSHIFFFCVDHAAGSTYFFLVMMTRNKLKWYNSCEITIPNELVPATIYYSVVSSSSKVVRACLRPWFKKSSTCLHGVPLSEISIASTIFLASKKIVMQKKQKKDHIWVSRVTHFQSIFLCPVTTLTSEGAQSTRHSCKNLEYIK